MEKITRDTLPKILPTLLIDDWQVVCTDYNTDDQSSRLMKFAFSHKGYFMVYIDMYASKGKVYLGFGEGNVHWNYITTPSTSVYDNIADVQKRLSSVDTLNYITQHIICHSISDIVYKRDCAIIKKAIAIACNITSDTKDNTTNDGTNGTAIDNMMDDDNMLEYEAMPCDSNYIIVFKYKGIPGAELTVDIIDNKQAYIRLPLSLSHSSSTSPSSSPSPSFSPSPDQKSGILCHDTTNIVPVIHHTLTTCNIQDFISIMSKLLSYYVNCSSHKH